METGDSRSLFLLDPDCSKVAEVNVSFNVGAPRILQPWQSAPFIPPAVTDLHLRFKQ